MIIASFAKWFRQTAHWSWFKSVQKKPKAVSVSPGVKILECCKGFVEECFKLCLSKAICSPFSLYGSVHVGMCVSLVCVRHFVIGQGGISHKGDVMMEINAIHHYYRPKPAPKNTHPRLLTAQNADSDSVPRDTPVSNTGDEKRRAEESKGCKTLE